MKKVVEIVKSLFARAEMVALLPELLKEIAKMQKEAQIGEQERAFLIRQLTALEKDVADLTMALAKEQKDKELLENEMASVILYIAKEEAK